MFGEKASNMFYIYIGLSQGSSLIPYLFIAFHSDLINLLGAHSGHAFADDLNVLIKLLEMRALAPRIEYFENEGTRVCDRISAHSKKWKQPNNITKQVVNIIMNAQKREVVKEFKYLGSLGRASWLKPTIDRCVGNVQRSLGKLR
jgi:hypothetical protein